MGARSGGRADAAVAQRDEPPSRQRHSPLGMLPLPTAKNWPCCAPGPSRSRTRRCGAGRRGGPGRDARRSHCCRRGPATTLHAELDATIAEREGIRGWTPSAGQDAAIRERTRLERRPTPRAASSSRMSRGSWRSCPRPASLNRRPHRRSRPCRAFPSAPRLLELAHAAGAVGDSARARHPRSRSARQTPCRAAAACPDQDPPRGRREGQSTALGTAPCRGGRCRTRGRLGRRTGPGTGRGCPPSASSSTPREV